MVDAVGDDPERVEELVADALLEFLGAQDKGTPLDLESWLSGFPPEVRSGLREVLEGLALLGSPRGPDVAPKRNTTAPRLADFGTYTGLEHLAAGGMGIIYRGMDKVL